MKQRGFCAIVFLIGCATGGVASQVVVPRAQAGTSPTRWEYFCMKTLPNEEQVTAALNTAGAQGWELVSATERFRTSSIGGGTDAIILCAKRAAP